MIIQSILPLFMAKPLENASLKACFIKLGIRPKHAVALCDLHVDYMTQKLIPVNSTKFCLVLGPNHQNWLPMKLLECRPKAANGNGT